MENEPLFHIQGRRSHNEFLPPAAQENPGVAGVSKQPQASRNSRSVAIIGTWRQEWLWEPVSCQLEERRASARWWRSDTSRAGFRVRGFWFPVSGLWFPGFWLISELQLSGSNRSNSSCRSETKIRNQKP